MNDGKVNAADLYTLQKIVKAGKQVVAGLKFFLDLELKRGGVTELHSFEVYNKFGSMQLNSHIIIDKHPEKPRFVAGSEKPHFIPGGHTQADLNDNRVVAAANVCFHSLSFLSSF